MDCQTILCPRCGNKLVDGASPCRRSHVTSPAIRALLIEAQRFKSKCAWNEAVEKCMDALKKDPENPDIYAVLGEIYEAQGRIDQAVQWYQMAETEYSAVGEPVVSLQEKIRRLESKRALLHQTTGWFDRYVAGKRFSASVRIVTFALVGFLLLLMLGAVFVILSDKMRDQMMTETHSQVAAPQEALETPSISAESSQDRLRIDPLESEQALRLQEQRLVDILNQDPVVSRRHIDIKEAVIDPQLKQLLVHFNISPFAGRPTKSHIMADSAAVCAASYKASPDTVGVTIYAFTDLPDEEGKLKRERVFVADTTRENPIKPDPSLTKHGLEKLFTNATWSSRIAE